MIESTHALQYGSHRHVLDAIEVQVACVWYAGARQVAVQTSGASDVGRNPVLHAHDDPESDVDPAVQLLHVLCAVRPCVSVLGPHACAPENPYDGVIVLTGVAEQVARKPGVSWKYPGVHETHVAPGRLAPIGHAQTFWPAIEEHTEPSVGWHANDELAFVLHDP